MRPRFAVRVAAVAVFALVLPLFGQWQPGMPMMGIGDIDDNFHFAGASNNDEDAIEVCTIGSGYVYIDINAPNVPLGGFPTISERNITIVDFTDGMVFVVQYVNGGISFYNSVSNGYALVFDIMLSAGEVLLTSHVVGSGESIAEEFETTELDLMISVRLA